MKNILCVFLLLFAVSLVAQVKFSALPNAKVTDDVELLVGVGNTSAKLKKDSLRNLVEDKFYPTVVTNVLPTNNASQLRGYYVRGSQDSIYKIDSKGASFFVGFNGRQTKTAISYAALSTSAAIGESLQLPTGETITKVSAKKWQSNKFFASGTPVLSYLVNGDTISNEAATLYKNNIPYVYNGAIGEFVPQFDVTQVENVAQLKTVKGARNGSTMLLRGYYTANDGGGQVVSWDSLSTATQNNGTIFQVTGQTVGRWVSVEKNSVNVLQFGAKADALGAATDNTGAFNSAIQAAKTVYIPQLNNDYYIVDSIVLKSGLNLIGLGQPILQDKPSSTAKALIVVPSFVLTTDVTIENLRFNGHGSNTNKVGLFINTTQGSGDGYFSHANFNNIGFVNFLGNTIWLRGGTNDYRNPIQQVTFRNLTVNSGITTNDVVKLSGQCSGIRFETGVITGNNKLNKTFTIERHRNFDGSLSGNTMSSFNVEFSAGFAFQTASIGLDVQSGVNICTYNCYFEVCKKGAIFRNGYATCSMTNTTFWNINDGGSGVCIETQTGENGIAGDLRITDVNTAAIDKFLTNDAAQCKTYVSGNIVGTITGLTHPNNGNTGKLDVLGYTTTMLTSTANIDSIVTTHAVGEIFYVKAHSQPIIFTNAGNIRLKNGQTRYILEQDQCLGFVKMDLAGGVMPVTATYLKSGRATLVAGTVTVTDATISANSKILVTVSTAGGTQGFLRTTKSVGASFTITSTSNTETSVVDYYITE